MSDVHSSGYESRVVTMSDETERVAVQTYVPAYQKELWTADADRMGMTQSEFVRTMVQAGRSDFEFPPLSTVDAEPADVSIEGDTEGDDMFRDRILELLDSDEPVGWDGLVDALTEEIEADLDRTLETLQSEDAIRYSGRQGGYVLRDDGER